MMAYMLGRCPAWTTISLALLALMAGGSVPSHAQAAPLESATLAPERTLLAASFASEKLWVWQKRLNLRDWDISVVVSRTGELKAKTLGHIRWDRGKKTAVIQVLDPADYHLPWDAMLRDIEFTVVHELIHLEMVPILSDLQRTDANRMEEEHAVNHMAEALLKLDRGQ
jgi:hypothetical protein